MYRKLWAYVGYCSDSIHSALDNPWVIIEEEYGAKMTEVEKPKWERKSIRMLILLLL